MTEKNFDRHELNCDFFCFYFFDDLDENTEMPAEWILIPSVLPAATSPTILIASPITGAIQKRPVPTTASPVKKQTIAQSTASRPKPTPASFDQGRYLHANAGFY